MRLNGGSLASRIVDILETVGGWLTVDQIMAEYETRFGETRQTSLSRACQHVRVAGFADGQLVENPTENGPDLLRLRFAVNGQTTEHRNGYRLGVADMTHGVFWGRVETQQAEYHAGRTA